MRAWLQSHRALTQDCRRQKEKVLASVRGADDFISQQHRFYCDFD
jgi:hypothetical protein